VRSRKFLPAVASGVFLILIHFRSAPSIVNTECEGGFPDSGLSVVGANVGGRVLAEFPGITFHGVEGMITVASEAFTRSGFIFRDAFGSMQTDVIPPRADFKLVLALDSKISIRTDTVFEAFGVRAIEMLEFFSERIDQAAVLCSLPTAATILTSQRASRIRLIGEFATGATTS
jgi:hypothetical protein